MAEIENTVETNEGRSIILKLKESVAARLNPYEKRTPTVLATILDPRFKKRSFRSNEEEKRAIQWLEKAYSTHLANYPETYSSVTGIKTIAGPSTSKAQQTKKTDDLLEFLDEPQTSTPLSDCIIDIRQYLEKPIVNKSECPFQYWKNSSSRLKELAETFLCICATSVPSERIFSKAGQIITERRNRLKAKTINTLLFLKQNASIFD